MLGSSRAGGIRRLQIFGGEEEHLFAHRRGLLSSPPGSTSRGRAPAASSCRARRIPFALRRSARPQGRRPRRAAVRAKGAELPLAKAAGFGEQDYSAVLVEILAARRS
ncbi:MAG: hypothetical protein M0Z66_00055 [Thermaerobacter sp.]|nr:hypothetical protein [Thermaerobacter sp.]